MKMVLMKLQIRLKNILIGDNMEENKCPQCGAKMKSDAKFCIFCGYINYDAPGNEEPEQDLFRHRWFPNT